MVQIKIKDNNRNREVAFIKTVPHTEKVFTDDDPKGHFQTVYYWEADPEDFFECKLPIDAFGKQNINKTTVMLIIDITNSTAHSFSPSSIASKIPASSFAAISSVCIILLFRFCIN